MAYMNQAKKAELAPAIKDVLKRYGVKGSISVDNYSSLVVTLREGMIDFGEDSYVNTFWIEEHFKDEPLKCEFLVELRDAMNVGNHNRSDIQSDYFDVGWYIDIRVGRWDKPYVCVAKKQAAVAV